MTSPERIQPIPAPTSSGRSVRKVYPVGNAYLTEREMDVLQLLTQGLMSKQIAKELHVSIKTIEKHRQSIYYALRVNSAMAATRVALRTGLISFEEWLGGDAGENAHHSDYVVSRHNAVAASPPAWFVS